MHLLIGGVIEFDLQPYEFGVMVITAIDPIEGDDGHYKVKGRVITGTRVSRLFFATLRKDISGQEIEIPRASEYQIRKGKVIYVYPV